MKEESGKAGLKLNINNSKIMGSSSITSWQIEEGKVEAVTDFIFLGEENKQWIIFNNIKKQRHRFADKGPHSQRYGFSSCQVQMW